MSNMSKKISQIRQPPILFNIGAISGNSSGHLETAGSLKTSSLECHWTYFSKL